MTDQELHVVIQERTTLFRKIGSVFITIAAVVAAITILFAVIAGDAPEAFLGASLAVALIGAAFWVIDWLLRQAKRGVRHGWTHLRDRRRAARDPKALDQRIEALEAELERLRAARLGHEAGGSAAGPTHQSEESSP